MDEPSRRESGVSPARECAYAVVRRVFEGGAWADRALHGEARRLQFDARDLGLATRLSYGTVQRVATLDHVIEALARRSSSKLDKPVLAALRLGIFQLTYLDRVPAHAAVGEAVELAKRDAPRGAGLVNAVLRRATREARPIIAKLQDTTPKQAALAHSHPEWIAQLVVRRARRARRPRADGRRQRARGSRPAREHAQDDRARVAGAPAPAGAARGEALILDEPFDAFSTVEWEDGLFMPQSRAAMAVARILGPQPGERVLDLCAAPGGKTTHLAALMRNEGEIVAVEQHAGRADSLRRTATRMGATIVDVHTGDAASPHATGFDRVLVDPAVQRPRHARLPARRALAQGGAPAGARGAPAARSCTPGANAIRPGGTLVYSTCTISPSENEQLVSAFLAIRPDFSVDDLSSELPLWKHPTMPQYLQTLPHRDRTDGFFIARLREEHPR